MKEIINTALIYISSFLTVNTCLLSRELENLKFPSPHTTPKENQIIQKVLSADNENKIYFVRDRLSARYCFAALPEHIVILGPYRENDFTRENIPLPLFPDKSSWEEYREYFHSLPLIENRNIKLAAHLIFTSIYGNSNSVSEEYIDIREYLKGSVPQADFSSFHIPPHINSSKSNDIFMYISYIRHGNYSAALKTYRTVMCSRGSHFILINVIEGLSNLRIQTRIALSLAGISEVIIDPLLTHFKVNGRNVKSIDEGIQLAEGLIASACQLVRQRKTSSYSPCIRAATDYILSHLDANLSIPELAEIADLSPNRFTTRFHSETGLTPTNFINKEKMQFASELLIYTNLPVQHICTDVGILDNSYFSRCFRKEFGISPTEFRKENNTAGNTRDDFSL